MKSRCQKKLILLAVLSLLSIGFSVSAEETGLIVKVKGSKANGVYSEFKVLVNDVDCGSEYASSVFEDHHFHTSFKVEEIDLIKIVFLNDLYSIGEDRNLCVHSIIINNDIPILASTKNVNYICVNGKEFPYCGMMQWNGALLFDISKLRFHPGNVTLSSQNEVNAFDLQYLDGSLTITGNDITDLAPLYSLTRINGALIIRGNPNLVDINGFNSLVKLGFISIENNSKLERLSGFNVLESCGGMFIQNNDKLKAIKCFQHPNIF